MGEWGNGGMGERGEEDGKKNRKVVVFRAM